MTKELQDEAMDMIVGGSSYLTELADFIQTGANGKPCFKYSCKTLDSWMSGALGADDHGMQGLIRKAERCGKITLIAASGAEQDFTAAQLQDMMKK